MVYFFNDADFDWAAGGRNLCLIINIHDAKNIADEFQVNGDAKGVWHLCMTKSREPY